MTSCDNQRRLMKRRETVRLSCTKQMGSARSSMSTTHPFHCPPETLIYFDFTINLVGGANVVCFVSFLIHRAMYRVSTLAQCSILVMKTPASLFCALSPSCYSTVFGDNALLKTNLEQRSQSRRLGIDRGWCPRRAWRCKHMEGTPTQLGC